MKVDTKELEDCVLAPDEPRVGIEDILKQARHQRLFQTSSRQGAKEILVAQAVEQLSEKQESLATLMESKKSLQKDALGHEKIFQELKEHKPKEAL